MSRDDDDARLYSCFKKYDEIVKQVLLLDELTDSMDSSRSRLSKRKSKQSRRGNSNGANGSVPDRESFDQVIVQSITRFLQDLNTTTVDPNPNPSAEK